MNRIVGGIDRLKSYIDELMNFAFYKTNRIKKAQSAKEIKDLVENAASKTDQGKKISDQMSSGYKNLNDLISKTTNIIQDVSVASSEQLSGIEQINNAITILDKVTQENANEASKVVSFADETLLMAQVLVDDAKTKKVN